MVLAVVRSHYGEKYTNDADRIYIVSEAISEWLGVHGWFHIVQMQSIENRAQLRLLLDANP